MKFSQALLKAAKQKSSSIMSMLRAILPEKKKKKH